MEKIKQIDEIKRQLKILDNKRFKLEIRLFELTNTNVKFEKDYIKRVAFYCEIWEFEISLKAKRKELVRARRLLILVLREYNLTYSYIWKILWTTHDSVIYLHKTWKKLLETDKNFKNLYDLIKNGNNI